MSIAGRVDPSLLPRMRMPSCAMPAGSISTVAPAAGMPTITMVPPRRTSRNASSTAVVEPATTAGAADRAVPARAKLRRQHGCLPPRDDVAGPAGAPGGGNTVTPGAEPARRAAQHLDAAPPLVPVDGGQATAPRAGGVRHVAV